MILILKLIALFFVLILNAHSQESIFKEYRTPIPSGYHYIDIPAGTIKFQLTVSWQDPEGLIDLDFMYFDAEDDIYVWWNNWGFAGTQSNPEVLKQILDPSYYFPSAIYVWVYPYNRKYTDYTVTLKLEDVKVYQETYFLFQNDLNSYTYAILPAFGLENGCKYEFIYEGSSKNPSLYLSYYQNGLSLNDFPLQSETSGMMLMLNPQEATQLYFKYNFTSIRYSKTFYDVKIKVYKTPLKTEWMKEISSCLDSCSNVQHALVRSSTDYLSCTCDTGYRYNKYASRCQFSCSVIAYAKPDRIIGNSSCECQSGFFWNGTLCLIDCSKISDASGNTPDYADVCECDFLYSWRKISFRCVYDTAAEEETLLIVLYSMAGALIFLSVITVAYTVYACKARQAAEQNSDIRKEIRPITYMGDISFSRRSIRSAKSQAKRESEQEVPLQSRKDLERVEEEVSDISEQDYKKSFKEMSELDEEDSN